MLKLPEAEKAHGSHLVGAHIVSRLQDGRHQPVKAHAGSSVNQKSLQREVAGTHEHKTYVHESARREETLAANCYITTSRQHHRMSTTIRHQLAAPVATTTICHPAATATSAKSKQ